MTFDQPCGNCSQINRLAAADHGKPYQCLKCRSEWTVPLPPSGQFLPRRTPVAVASAATTEVVAAAPAAPAETPHGWFRTALFSPRWFVRYPRMGVIWGLNAALKPQLEVAGVLLLGFASTICWELLGIRFNRTKQAGDTGPSVAAPDTSPDVPG